ncbi:hypothetical protein BD410DRAFT_783658 [Rickenella mellea]|uniref:Nephrocystin 3-like N-terminal domain-containing protein n=1 Tax=Rickenella mellea TaxID=50990 RepID=A0A4Y7QGW4_9AGAM|nr:hypothetical protein BD410DRAFT_783658 [Rickenella mellea]
MALKSGVYTIVNVRNRNWAVVLNDNDLGDVVAGSSADEHAGEKWNIQLISNGNYILRNQRYDDISASYHPSISGNEKVTTRRNGRLMEWKIYLDDTGRGYRICTQNLGRCWTLPDDDTGTEVALEQSRPQDRQLWIFVTEGGLSLPSAVTGSGSAPPDNVVGAGPSMGAAPGDAGNVNPLPSYRSNVDLAEYLRDVAVPNAGYECRQPEDSCLVGTREEVISNILHWAKDRNEPPVCWLSAGAGVGKSAIAQTVADRLAKKQRLLASFFFRRGEGDRASSSRFILTLAHQLSLSVPSILPLIGKAFKNERVVDQPLDVQLTKLLVEPLLSRTLSMPIHRKLAEKLTNVRVPNVIVIDGLDECDDKQEMTKFIKAIAKATGDSRSLIRFFFTSRVEEHIRQPFEGLPSVTHRLRLDDFDASTDLRVFLRSRFDNMLREKHPVMRDVPRPWPSYSDLDALIKQSSGLFIFVSTLVEFVKAYQFPDDALKMVLDASADTGIDPLYRQVLSSANRGKQFDQVFSTILLVRRPLSITHVGHLLRLPAKVIVDELLQVQSIVRIPDDNSKPVQLMHTSLRDFLTTKQRSGNFFIDPLTRHAAITFDCLMVIKEGPEPKLIWEGEVELYACYNWYQHLLEGTKSVPLDSLPGKLISSLKNFQSKLTFDTWRHSTVNRASSALSTLTQHLTQLQNCPETLLQYISNIQRHFFVSDLVSMAPQTDC